METEPDRLLPLDEAWQRLRGLGLKPFLIDELIERARKNRDLDEANKQDCGQN